MSSEASEARYATYNEKLKELKEILKKNKKELSDKEINKVVDTTFDMLKELANMHDKSGKIRTNTKFTKEEQLEIAENFLKSVKESLKGINNNYGIIQNAYDYVLKENPFNIHTDDNRGDIFAQISNQILLASIFDNKNLKPSLSSSIGKRNARPIEKAAINKYYQSLEKEENKKNKEENKRLEQLVAKYQLEISKIKENTALTDKQKEEEIKKIEEERDIALKGVKITKDKIDTVVGGVEDILKNTKVQNAALGELLKKNKSDILNDVALTLAGNPDLKKNIRKIKGDLKASNPDYSDGDINYIISKALSENERYLKTVAANPDLFERDMSNDTIQKENEQFQSKLRQQNLRYILPKFIERREKLVENTLNPNLLKGAFAI